MNIALVTNKKLHHKFWSFSLYKSLNVKLIIHPNRKTKFINLLKYKMINYGGIYFLLKIMSVFYNLFFNDERKYQLKYFSKYSNLYNQIPKDIIYNVDTINSIDSINLIKKNKIDIICFLGGDIAGLKFIESPRINTLNFHSGLSPYFNGNSSILNAFVYKRPGFSGGTLMIMNEKIDLGNILSHYLCPIAKDDNPYDLFMKTIIGSVKLYQDYVNYQINNKKKIFGVKQNNSFSYFKNIDWSISEDIKLKKYKKSGLINKYIRDEKIIKYYDLKTSDFNKLINKSLLYIFDYKNR